MAHKTLINGTSYEISGGKTVVDGAGYSIAGGRALIGGTGYNISFGPYDPVFANNTWAEIIEACQTDAVPTTWVVGDSKTMTINGTDYIIDIIGRNHDVYSDGSGTAPLTFQMHDCYLTSYKMNATATNVGGWESSEMRTTHLPAVLALMPSEVRNEIKEVNKLTSVGSKGSTVVPTADKLFLLSEVEVFGVTGYSKKGEGERYAYYAAGNSPKKKIIGSSPSVDWWLRSPYYNDAYSFCASYYLGGRAESYSANWGQGLSIAFAFCF